MNYLLNENHDIVVGKRITRTAGARYVAQNVKCRLGTFLGEWMLDVNVGIPWDAVLVRNYDIGVLYHADRRKIETTPDVTRINSFTLTPNKKERKLYIQFEAVTTFGVISEVVSI